MKKYGKVIPRKSKDAHGYPHDYSEPIFRVDDDEYWWEIRNFDISHIIY